jgi:hypothetical protein
MSNLTTEQMKQALSQAGVAQVKAKSEFSAADVVAAIGSGAVATAEEAVSGTVSFFDRVRTRYAYNRAIAQGLISDQDAKPEVKATVTTGDYGTVIAGKHGTAIAGEDGTVIAGDRGTAIAGKYGTVTRRTTKA